VHLSGQKIPEARAAVDQALAITRQNFGTRLSVQATAARVQEPGSRADAIKRLTAVVEEATRSGHIRLSFEARLWLAEIEIRSGARDLGRAHLAAIEKDATAKGFALIARKGHAALER
jgi:hypothetical protein